MTVGSLIYKQLAPFGTKGGYEPDFYDMEFKALRRVRTPAGAKRFKVPIGSVILGNGKRLENLTLSDSDYAGFDKVKTKKGKELYIGKFEGDKVHVVTDANDKILYEGDSLEDVFEWADGNGDGGGGRGSGGAKKPATAAAPDAEFKPITSERAARGLSDAELKKRYAAMKKRQEAGLPNRGREHGHLTHEMSRRGFNKPGGAAPKAKPKVVATRTPVGGARQDLQAETTLLNSFKGKGRDAATAVIKGAELRDVRGAATRGMKSMSQTERREFMVKLAKAMNEARDDERFPRERRAAMMRAYQELRKLERDINSNEKADTMEDLDYKAVPVSSITDGVEDEGAGVVTALVAVTGIKDNVNDIIMPGAFEKSLIQRKAKGVWHHDVTSSVSKTLDIKELRPGDAALPVSLPNGDPWPSEAGGLWVKMMFNLNTQRGRDAYEDVKFFGADQEWSIGYNVPTGGAITDRKTGTRSIHTLNLYEYSPVLFGAMPNARTLMDVKSAQHCWKTLCSADNLEFKSLMDELVAEQKAERTVRSDAGARRYGKKVGDKYGSGAPRKKMEEDESPEKGARGGKLTSYSNGIARYDDGTATDGKRWFSAGAGKGKPRSRTRGGTHATKSDEFMDLEDMELMDIPFTKAKPDDEEEDWDDEETAESEEDEEEVEEDEEEDEEEKGFFADLDFKDIDQFDRAIDELTDLRDLALKDWTGESSMGSYDYELKDDLVSLCKDAGLAVESDAAAFDSAVADGDADAMSESADAVLDAVEEALKEEDPDKEALRAVTGKIAGAFQDSDAEDETEETDENSEEDEEKSEVVVLDTKSFLAALED